MKHGPYSKTKPLHQYTIGVGMEVYFRAKVYRDPYAPYYDAYKGHKFKVVALHDDSHVELTCISDPTVQVGGYVHQDELKKA